MNALRNALAAEWIKLARRPLVWVLLVVFLVLLVANLLLLFVAVALHDGTFTGGMTRVQLLREAQIAQYRLQLQLPGVFGAVLGQVNGVGGILAIILAAASLGSEYHWGTLRLQLARQPDRGRFLAAKLIMVLLFLLLGTIVALVAGALIGAFFGFLLGTGNTFTPADGGRLVLAVARALLVLLPYVSFTLACCVLGRSVLAGVGGGLLFLAVDSSLGALALLPELSGLPALLYNLVIQPNITTLVVLNSTSFGLDPAVLVRTLDRDLLPPPLQATLLVTAYSLLFLGTAYYWLTRHDIGGAA